MPHISPRPRISRRTAVCSASSASRALDLLAAGPDVAQHVVALDHPDRLGAGGEGELVAAEGAGVRAGRPAVQLLGVDAGSPPAGPSPLSAFDATITSGSMSYCSNANQVPVRPHPVCTSSTISGMPSSRVSRRTRCTNSCVAGITPPSPCTISMITAAGSSMPAVGVAQRPLEEADAVGLAGLRVQPQRAVAGRTRTGRSAPRACRWRSAASAPTLPVSAIAAWLLPWKPPWKETIPPRPVAVLHSLIAASTRVGARRAAELDLHAVPQSPGSIDSWAR